MRLMSIGVLLLVGFPFGLRADDVQQLVKHLDSDQFAQRQAATDQLASRGVAAIPAIVKAASSPQREVATRAHSILKSHFESGDAETKQAAKQALEQLARGEGAAARRAEQTLQPKPNPGDLGRIFAPRRIVLNGRAGNIRVRQLQVNGRRVRVQQVNRTTKITVEENGRKIVIEEDLNNGIKIEVSEKKDGKQVSSKYQAKDAADLKKRHPAAYKIYEKYGKQNGVVRIQVAQGIRAVPAAAAQNRQKHFQQMKKAIDDRIQQYEQKAKQAEGPQKQQYQRMVETFRQQRKMIEQMEQRIMPALPGPAQGKKAEAE